MRSIWRATKRICEVPAVKVALVFAAPLIFRRSVRLFSSKTWAATEQCLTPCGNRIPGIKHLVLSRKHLKPGRLILVGDVHGCNSELQSLLLKLDYDKARDNLILVGDVVNKGPDSVGVLQTMIDQGAWAVRGNHDDKSLSKWLEWQMKGSTSAKYAWVMAMNEQQANVLQDLPFTIHLPDYGIMIVHAGLVPQSQHNALQLVAGSTHGAGCTHGAEPHEQGLVGCADDASVAALVQSQDMYDMLCMRELRQQPGNVANDNGCTRLIWEASDGPCEGSQSWASAWPGPQHVFFGHDAKRRLQLQPHATGLDTGCVYGGSLTAAVIPPLATLLESSHENASKVLQQYHDIRKAANSEVGVDNHGLTGVAGAAHLMETSQFAVQVAMPYVTREALNVQLVSVAAEKVWSEPNSKAVAASNKA